MTSTRVSTSMDEIFARQNRHAAMVISNKRNRTSRSRKNHARQNSITTDGGFLIQRGYGTTLDKLVNARRITAVVYIFTGTRLRFFRHCAMKACEV